MISANASPFYFPVKIIAAEDNPIRKRFPCFSHRKIIGFDEGLFQPCIEPIYKLK
jgi:hypothetical protein